MANGLQELPRTDSPKAKRGRVRWEWPASIERPSSAVRLAAPILNVLTTTLTLSIPARQLISFARRRRRASSQPTSRMLGAAEGCLTIGLCQAWWMIAWLHWEWPVYNPIRHLCVEMLSVPDAGNRLEFILGTACPCGDVNNLFLFAA